MRRKIITIITILGLTALLVFLVYVFFSSIRRQPQTQEQAPRSLFPFRTQSLQDTSDQIVDIPDEQISDDNNTYLDVPSLRKIAGFPITTFTTFYKTDTIVRPKQQDVVDTTSPEKPLMESEQNNVDEDKDIKDEVIEIDNLYVRYNKKENGFIYESQINNSITSKQLTDTEIPLAEEGGFNHTTDIILLRFFNSITNKIETLVGSFPKKGFPDNLCITPFTEELQPGSEGTPVELLQIFLAYQLSKEVEVDGSFGSGTTNLIKEFQSENSITETGLLDELTRTKINEHCALVIEEKNRLENSFTPVSSRFLPENIPTFAISPSKEKVFYTLPQQDTVVGIVYNFDTRERTQVFQSSFSEWLPQWSDNNHVTLTTKPSSIVPGFMYEINTEAKSLRKVLSNIPGLTTKTNFTNNLTIFNETINNTFLLKLFNNEDKQTKILPIITLPEKCVWATDQVSIYCAVPQQLTSGSYPDDWYKGKISFSDTMWRINTTTNSTELVFNPIEEVGEEMDMVSLQLDPKELYLFFINKKTGEPWVYTLE